MATLRPVPTPSAATVALSTLDEWISRVPDSRLQDQLLDLRAAWATPHPSPRLLVRSFLRLRPLLCRDSYLSQHRLRRALERQIVVEVTTPERCWTEPLQLHWNSLGRTLDQVRRQVFEHGRDDWAAIRVRLTCKPKSDHGEDTL